MNSLNTRQQMQRFSIIPSRRSLSRLSSFPSFHLRSPPPRFFLTFFPLQAQMAKVQLTCSPPPPLLWAEKRKKRKRKRRRKKGVRRSEMSTPTYIGSISMGNGGRGRFYNTIGITLSSSFPAMQKLTLRSFQIRTEMHCRKYMFCL